MTDQPQKTSEEDSSPNELEKLKLENEKLQQENERIRKDKLEEKTSSAYLKDRQVQQKRQREAKMLNQNLAPAQRLSKEQTENMTASDIIDYVNRMGQKVYSAVTREKIVPMMEQSLEDTTRAQLSSLDRKVPFWKNYLDDMEPIAVADPNLNAEEVLRMAVAKKGDMKKLEEVISLLSDKPKPKEEPLMPKEEETVVEKKPRPVVSGGEKPTVSVGKVTTPQKAMSPKEAAAAAYEEQRNLGG